MAKTFFDKINLNSGMSLMISDTPNIMDLSKISISKPKLEIEKFGLFESATPNFHTYYPDIKNAADIKPNEGDYIKPVFRLLSKVIVRKNTNPVDFSMGDILKESMPKLLAQTVYANHEAVVGNELGSVSNVMWQENYTTDKGVKVPAGINGEFKIDAKSHPTIARGILQEPPSIHSNSVTISFGWEMSHPKMDINEFRSKLGTYDAHKQLIRRIANQITGYHETSLVAHGADPFAQKIGNDGKINNADYADSIYSLSAQGKSYAQVYFFNYRDDVISLTEDNSTLTEHNNITDENMKDLILKLVALTGKTEAEITESFIEDYFKTTKDINSQLTAATTKATTFETELNAEKVKVADLTNKLTAEEGKVTTLTADVTKYKPAFEGYVTKLRAEVKKTYEVLKGDKKDPAILTLIESAGETALTAYSKQYQDELEEKFPASCKSCGSKDIARNTAEIEDPAGNVATKKFVAPSDAELAQQLRDESKSGFILDKKA